MVAAGLDRPVSASARRGGTLLAAGLLGAGGRLPLERLPEADRLRLVVGLSIVVLLGLLLLAVAWLVGRWIRRSIRGGGRRFRPGRIGPSDWEPGGMTAPRTPPSKDDPGGHA